MTCSEIDDPAAAEQSPHPSRDFPRLVQLLAWKTSRVTDGAAEAIEERVGGEAREVVRGQAPARRRQESHASILSLLAPAGMATVATAKARTLGLPPVIAWPFGTARVVTSSGIRSTGAFTARNSRVTAGAKCAKNSRRPGVFSWYRSCEPHIVCERFSVLRRLGRGPRPGSVTARSSCVWRSSQPPSLRSGISCARFPLRP